MSDPKKLKPIERLMMAMEDCAVARGNASWTQGYRAAKGEPQETVLYAKELGQWAIVGRTERKFRRNALAVLREVGRPTTPKKRRSRPSPQETRRRTK